MNTYDIGDQVRLTATFKNRSGSPADPTTVTFTYQKPGGPVISDSGAVVKDSTGVYHYDLTLDNVPGKWRYRFAGTGALIAAEEGEFRVDPSVLV